MATSSGKSAVTFRTVGPTGAIAETVPRNQCNSETQAKIAAGSLCMTAAYLPRGIVVTNVGWRTGTQAAVTPTHSWTALYSLTRVLMAQSADQTTLALGASTFFSWALTTPQPITSSGLYYLALMCTGDSTVATTAGCTATPASMNTGAPILTGVADNGLTTTAPATATTISADLLTPYMWVS